MKSFGEVLVVATSDYLKQNGLTTLGQINREVLRDVADRTYNHYRSQIDRQEQALSDEEWLARLQKREGEMGLNVRQQYSTAQAWYENNGQVLTRRKFMDWLKKADRPLAANSKPAKAPVKLDPYQVPQWDWMRVMAQQWPKDTHPDRPNYEEMKWAEVPITVRVEILKAYEKAQ